ncbi:hypothetical protein CDV26_08665 [Francisella halioticida]|uniref:Uncharacterized protein n=1 Tax=Francisella halioticida TaxID=549298 RepID=A0ABM6M0L8_9GAMM|nr:hypothetical protein [Francisella halioticida]ASG68455.1 hypothetical protein CDV26_08665 [Francisella halioticida]
MLNYYNLLVANIFTIYIFLRLFGFLQKKILLIIVIVLLALNLINVTSNNETIYYFIIGVTSYFSFSSFLFLVSIIASIFINNKTTIFPYTSLAFLPIMIIFYGLFFVSSYKLYDFGFNPYIVTPFIFIYGLALLSISKRFILFNTIIVLSSAMLLTHILQVNIWNYLLDPTLLIICIIEVIRSLITHLSHRKQKSNIKIEYY